MVTFGFDIMSSLYFCSFRPLHFLGSGRFAKRLALLKIPAQAQLGRAPRGLFLPGVVNAIAAFRYWRAADLMRISAPVK